MKFFEKPKMVVDKNNKIDIFPNIKEVISDSQKVIEQIDSLELLTKELVLRLENSVKDEQIGAAIGLDTSGRVPALILMRVLNHIRHSERKPAIPLKFFPGLRTHFYKLDDSSDYNPKQLGFLKKSLDRLGLLEGQKILIIDDYVNTGGTIRNIVIALEKLGFIPKVVVLGDSYKRRGNYIGKYSAGGGEPQTYGNQNVSGVKKIKGEISSQPIRTYPRMTEISRKAATKVANRVIEWYEQQKHGEQK